MKLSEDNLKRLTDFVRNRYGINLGGKRALVEARLAFDISRRGYTDFGRYIDEVTAFPDGEECQHMINRLSTNYTFFFRENEYIDHLIGGAMPGILTGGKSRVSVWCAGCAGGQEAYSVAMVLKSSGFPYSITATDINTDVLEKARAGRYAITELKDIPAKYRPYVRLCGTERFEITDEIKRAITWKRENLINERAPDMRFDIIFCRNVLIYFDPDTRRRTAVRLYDALNPGGYLYAGIMENMDFRASKFNYVAPAIYRKGNPL